MDGANNGMTTFTLHMPQPGMTVDEVLELTRQHFQGSEFYDLVACLHLYLAGHYPEAIEFASKVVPSPESSAEPAKTADRPRAHAAFIAASERARPLYEQAALEIEGQVESSQTMANYYSTLEAMRNNLDS